MEQSLICAVDINMPLQKHCKPHRAIQAFSGCTGRKEGRRGGVGPEGKADKGPQPAFLCCSLHQLSEQNNQQWLTFAFPGKLVSTSNGVI